MKNNTYKLFKGLIQPAGVVLGLHTLNGLSTLRSLGIKKIPLLGIDRHKFTIGSFSKYCTSVEVSDKEESLLELLEGIGQISRHKSLIYCSHDNYLLFIDKYKEWLNKYFYLFLPKRQPLKEVMNKEKMCKLAKKTGFDTPVTFYSNDNSLEEISNKITYPAIIKPLYSQGYKTKVETANNKQELYTAVRKDRFQNKYLVQEVITGPEENIWFYAGYCNRNSRPLALFSGHKMRQLPRSFGIATVAVSGKNIILADIADKTASFLKDIGYHGCFGFEFKKDKERERLNFIEVNYRICDWNQAAIASGIDLPYIAYCDTLGFSCQKNISQKDGILWVSILDDFITCCKYYSKKNKLVFFDWIKKVLLADSYAVFKVTDIKPFIYKIISHLMRIIRKLALHNDGNNENI